MTEDQLIATYKEALMTEAELARGDLDEIEDHLRALAGELRDHGMPGAAAVREACRRLGDPRVVAREHARVRSPFGAKLPRLRAYSAVALAVPILVRAASDVFPIEGIASRVGLQIVLAAIVTLALALRLAWARPIVLGGIACFGLVALHAWLAWHHGTPVWLVAYAGMFAFLVPWRSHELTTSGWALALNAYAFGCATFGLMWDFVTPDNDFRLVAPAAMIAFATTIVATSGTVLRAKWSAIPALASAAALFVTVLEMSARAFTSMSPIVEGFMMAIFVSGVFAASLGTLLTWRTSRSPLGTLQFVLR